MSALSSSSGRVPMINARTRGNIGGSLSPRLRGKRCASSNAEPATDCSRPARDERHTTMTIVVWALRKMPPAP
jgi:hypothetical protein